MNTNFWNEVKKQSFSVLLLVVAVVSLFTYFTGEIKNLKVESNARISQLERKLDECQEERIREIKDLQNRDLAKGSFDPTTAVGGVRPIAVLTSNRRRYGSSLI
jgi:hypothetical protein